MINKIKEQLAKRHDEIEAWFQEKFQQEGEPFYASVDIRNSHHKIAVIDTNAFPAGFNNLCPRYTRGLVSALRDYLSRHHPAARRVLLYPEHHTRNRFYLENVRRLIQSLEQAGYETKAGIHDPALRTDSITLPATEGEITLHRIEREGNRIKLNGFEPDLIISNNDFSTGEPAVLKDLEIPVLPPLAAGWHRRRKHEHFLILNRLVEEFAQMAGVHPFHLATCMDFQEPADINDPESRKTLADKADRLLACIRKEYEQLGIQEEPFLFLKNDAGTYGMAVMTVRSGEQIKNASRKVRTKMSTGKGGMRVGSFLLQEGVRTRDFFQGSPMEPVIYLVGRTPVGGFYRLHRERSDAENLNVPRMEFRRLCFHQVSETHPESLDDGCEDAADLLLVYGALGRLAALALAMEMKARKI